MADLYPVQGGSGGQSRGQGGISRCEGSPSSGHCEGQRQGVDRVPRNVKGGSMEPWARPLTEKLDPSFVKRVVQTLFPENPGQEEPSPPSGVPHPDWHDGVEMKPKDNWGEALSRAEVAVSAVLRSIRGRGLAVAVQKTKAVYFHDGSNRPPSVNQFLLAGTARIVIQSEMHYLGLIIDERWTFRSHLEGIVRHIRVRAAALDRLLPNLGDPGTKILSRRIDRGRVSLDRCESREGVSDRVACGSNGDRRSPPSGDRHSGTRQSVLRYARSPGKIHHHESSPPCSEKTSAPTK
ncbi:hypothetical protein KM043_017914 [Ampulex compressa]|nr:hypothetical protein KM043_017914 [Ampulex compressa]